MLESSVSGKLCNPLRIDSPAEEDIDEEHDGEEDSKGDGEVGEPGGVGAEAPGRSTD